MITEVNDNGDRRTTTVERDGAGRQVRREVDRRNADGSESHSLDRNLPGGGQVSETRTRDAQGNETTDRTETDARGHTKRVKTTIAKGRNSTVTTVEEFVDGVRRHKRVTTFYPASDDQFVDDMWWDDKGKAYGADHQHYKKGVKQFDYPMTLPLTMRVPFDRHEGGLVLITRAGAGSVIGGYADPALYGETHRVRLRSGERCASVKPGTNGRFQLPPGVTSEGDAVVEIVDCNDKVAVSRTIAIGPAQTGAPKITAIESDPGDKRLIVARGTNFAAVPETAERFETWSGALVLFKGELFTDVASPIAWSDQEMLFGAPQERLMIAIHDGAAATSEPVDCPITARPPC